MFDFPRGTGWYYRGSFALSVALWTVLLWPAARRTGVGRHLWAAVFVAVFTLVLGVQGGFWACFNTYLTPDAEVFSRSFGWTLLGTLPVGRPLVWFHLTAAAVTAALLVRVARRVVPQGEWQRRLGPPLAVLLIGGILYAPASYRRRRTSVSASTAEHLYFATMKTSYLTQLGLGKTELRRPQRRSALPVPPLTRRPAAPRNVLFVLQESQRVDVTCLAYDPNCRLSTPASNAAVPKRMPLLQMRANDSSTTLSCSTLWTGLVPSAPEQDLLRAPTLWGYAKAAGYHTSYFTSQFVIFHNMRMQMQDEPLDLFACATTLEQRADFDVGAKDALLTEWVIDHWDRLEEPFYSVVQYSNQHSPYLHDPKQALFDLEGVERGTKEYQDRFYRNVVYLSDLAVGRLLEHVRRSEKGARTVIVYTADHAEAMGEHGLAGHTFSVFDNEIKVPTWIDAPPGTLSDAERISLRRAKWETVFHVDLATTLLDLLGVWDAPELAPFRAKMIGHPITRPERTVGPVPLTNCSELWECQAPNWGVMAGRMKLAGTAGMKEYSCFDVASDPAEHKDLGEEACGDLVGVADSLFPRLDQAVKPYHPLR